MLTAAIFNQIPRRWRRFFLFIDGANFMTYFFAMKMASWLQRSNAICVHVPRLGYCVFRLTLFMLCVSHCNGSWSFYDCEINFGNVCIYLKKSLLFVEHADHCVTVLSHWFKHDRLICSTRRNFEIRKINKDQLMIWSHAFLVN